MTRKKGGRKYAIKGKKDKDVYLQAITMIDAATDRIEIHSVPEARADLVANQVKLAWLTISLYLYQYFFEFNIFYCIITPKIGFLMFRVSIKCIYSSPLFAI